MKIRFKVERDITGCDPDELWRRLSDISSIPKYWQGHRSVKILEQKGSSYRVEVQYAFPSLAKGNVGESMIEVERRTGRSFLTTTRAQ